MVELQESIDASKDVNSLDYADVSNLHINN